jgi:hypothetical protein
MDKQRRPDAAQDVKPASQSGRSTNDAATDGGGAMAGAQAGATCAYDKAALYQAIDGHQCAAAIGLASLDPARAMTDLRAGMPNDSFDDADFLAPPDPRWGVSKPNVHIDAFFQLVRDGKPYSALTRAQLEAVYKGLGFEDKKRLVEAQFNVSLSGKGSADYTESLSTIGGADFTEAELDTLYAQAAKLPQGHVEGNPHFVELMRTQNAVAEGSHSGDKVNMDAEANAARYSQVFRHEVGHAVDDRIGGATQDLRLNQAGWKQYAAVDEWIAALGGYGDIPAALQPTVRKAVQAYLGKGNTFKAPTATFEETLWAQVWAAHPGDTLAADGSDAATRDLQALRALYKTNMLLCTCIASQGDTNYFRFAQWPAAGDRVFFISHYYARGYSLSVATHSHLKSWGDSSAAFSDKEWFAEIYAEWYKNGEGGAHMEFPGFVTRFFQNVVEKMGSPSTVAGGGGNHPKVPR